MRIFTSILLISSVLAIVLISGCKKDDDGAATGAYYIRFKADGQLTEFTNQVALNAATGQSQSQYNAVVSGFNGNHNISVQMFDNEAIHVSVYEGYENKVSYFEGALIGYGKDGVIYGTNGVNPEVVVNLTHWTATEAKGTFSGKVKAISGPTVVSITEGEFFVKRLN